MKIETVKSVAAPLSGAYYTVDRDGQQSPAKGDNVLVRLRIFLANSPFVSEDQVRNLRGDLKFDHRLEFCDEWLDNSWGSSGYGDFRYEEYNFSATKWSVAFDLATKYAEDEILKLETALAIRAMALIDAE